MPNADWDRVKQIFHEVLEKTGPERDQLLLTLCGDDSELRSNVQTLLAAHGEAGQFMDGLTFDGLDPAAAASIGLASQEPPEGLGTRIGAYKLLQVIGEGGFGVVYMAEQEEPIRRRVALKVIKPGMDTKQVIARFEAERQALAMMDHPNIAKVFEAGTTPAGRPYFVMELVKGIPITDYCDEHRLGTRERLALFSDVCGAVDHANKAGIIHRDIKPSNVMITLHDGTPVPKVIDFGVAKATHQRLTDSTLFTEYNQFIGTPTYMSPEQAAYEGLEVDTRADVYSLGVLLYELLTGTTPHDSKALKRAAYLEVIRIIKEDEPPKPSTRIQTMGISSEDHAKHRHASAVGLAKVLRGDLDWIVMKALEKERSRRYGSASEMADDISRYFDQLPIVARPPSAVYRTRKLLRRRRGPIATAAILALAVGLDVAYVGWQGSQDAAASALAGDALRRVSVGNVEFLGAVSADGRYMPFRYEREGDLWVRDLVTGDDSQLTRSRTPSFERVEAMHISQDGEQIAYSWIKGAKSVDLRIIGRDGSGQRVLYANEDVIDIDPNGWTPDGREILARFQLTDGTFQLVFVSTADGSVRVVKSLALERADAQLSPDGRYVAYSVPPEPGRLPNIFLLAADGSQEVPLLDNPRNERPLAWTPDSKGLIYRSNRTGLWDAWMMQIEDGRPRGSAQLVHPNIRGRNASIRGRGMSADGTFFYTLRTDQDDIYSATLDPVTGQVLVPPQRIAPDLEGNPLFAPDFSRDGKYLAYTRARTNGARVMVRDLATGDERSVRDVNGYVRWSPDGGSFLMHNDNGIGNTISLVNVETDEVTGVTGPVDARGRLRAVPGVADVFPQWLPDGEAIIYIRRNQRTNSHHVLMRDLETGRETELYQALNVSNIALSSDGEQLALWTETRAGVLALQIVPVAGGEPRELIRSGRGPYTASLAWTPDGRHLLLVKRNADPETQFPHELWRIAVEGGEPESLGLKAEGGIWQVRVHPDGQRIVFTSGQRVTELLAAENFLAGKQGSDE